MVYKFKVTIDEDKDFYMEVQVKDTNTFYDLHNLFLNDLNYDKGYIYTFYVVDHNWKIKQEIPQIIFDEKQQKGVETMDKAYIKKYIKDAHQKFIYIFDNINNRGFKLELIETLPEDPTFEYPFCSEFRGNIPSQTEPIEKDNFFIKKSSLFSFFDLTDTDNTHTDEDVITDYQDFLDIDTENYLENTDPEWLDNPLNLDDASKQKSNKTNKNVIEKVNKDKEIISKNNKTSSKNSKKKTCKKNTSQKKVKNTNKIKAASHKRKNK